MSKCLRIIFVILILLLNAFPVYGADSSDVTITATPLMSTGILNFMMIYTSDTQVDFTWDYGTDVNKIMIRGKYGNYPNDIPDINTAPSDGYLIYYGAGNAASDTSVNFDQNPGPLFVKAWGQRPDGTWELIPDTGSQESKQMLLLGVISIVAIVSFVSYKSRNILPSLVAFGGWIGLWYFIQATYTVTLGQNVVTIVLLVCIGIGAYLCFRCFQDRDTENRNPFKDAPNTVRSVSVQSQPKRKANERETPEEYRLRARRALNSHRG